MKRVADALSLSGWIRNLPDGSVEMVVQGTSEKLDTFLLQINEHFDSYIQSIDLKNQTRTTLYTDFQVTS